MLLIHACLMTTSFVLQALRHSLFFLCLFNSADSRFRLLPISILSFLEPDVPYSAQCLDVLFVIVPGPTELTLQFRWKIGRSDEHGS